MAEKLLSDVQCRNATSEGKAIRKLHDGGGLYLWVYQDGKKYWRLRYYVSGKEKSKEKSLEKSLSLGVYPDVSLKAARAKFADARKQLESGIDPSTERKAVKRVAKQVAANTFQCIANEWYEDQKAKWSAAHATDIRRRLDKNLFPELGKRPISEIDVPELKAVLKKVGQRYPDLAHRLRSLCSQIFIYGVASDYCPRNPAADLSKALKATRVVNMPAVGQKELPTLLRDIAAYTGNRQTTLGLQMLARVFTRTNELTSAEWSEFDFEAALWEIPANRMKGGVPHLVPLTAQTIAILHELRVLAGNSRFVFPGNTRGSGKPMSPNTLLYALHRLGYKNKMSGHGFRTVASTILHESGFESDWIERQLAHGEVNKVKATYNKARYLDGRRTMMQWWCDYLDAIEGGAKVIPIFSAA